MIKKPYRRYILLFFIILLIGFFLKRNWQWAYDVVPQWQLSVDMEIEDLAILDGGTTVTWDGDLLSFYDKKGKLVSEVDRTAEGQRAFLGHSKAILYDGDLKKISVFDARGREVAAYSVGGEIFSVDEQMGNILIFTKQDKGEILYLGDQMGGLEALFQTDHFILDYFVEDSNHFTVSELSTEASGYKTTLYWKEGDLKKEEFPNEVSMEIGFVGKSPIMATEKTLYRVNSDQVDEAKIPLISDIYFDSTGIYLLHSGILSKYNEKLEKVDQEVMVANVTLLKKMEGSLMALGKGEILGNLMGPREFQVRLDQKMDLWDLKDGCLIAYSDGNLSSYGFKKKLFSPKKGPLNPVFEEDKKE